MNARGLVRIGMAGALVLFLASPALAGSFDQTEEPFVQGAQIYQPGAHAPFAGQEALGSDPQEEESFVQGAQIYQPGYQPQYAGPNMNPALHASGRASVYDVPSSPGLPLQRPWSDSEEALGVFN